MISQNMPEKRRYPRVEMPKGMRVAWEGSGKGLVSQVIDLSLGGAFIQTADSPSVGSSVKLIFEILDRNIRARHCTALRAWCWDGHRICRDGLRGARAAVTPPERAGALPRLAPEP